MIITKRTLKNKILKKILFWGTLIIITTYFIMFNINFNASKWFNEDRLSQQMNIIKSLIEKNPNIDLKEQLKEIQIHDKYINKISINKEEIFNNKSSNN